MGSPPEMVSDMQTLEKKKEREMRKKNNSFGHLFKGVLRASAMAG